MLSNKVQYVNADTAVVNELNNMELYMPFRKTIFYINNTTEDVVVVHRNNLPISVRKAATGIISMKNFIVRTIYKFQGSGEIVETINMITEYQKLNGDGNAELQAIKETLTDAFNNNRSLQNCEIIIDATVLVSTINKLKVCYCPTADVLLMSKDYHANINHPYSAEGRTLQQFKDMGVEVKHAGVIVEIVDNESKYGKRFMKFGKSFVEIEPRTDNSRTSGVYITELKNAGGQTSSTTGSFTIDEAQERYGIYPTLEQATSGDQAEQLSKSKLIIAQTQLEQQRVENSISLETARYETETFKSSLQQKEHEMAKLRMELEESVLTAKRAHAEAEIKVRHSKIELEHLKDSLSASAAVSDNMYKEKSRSRDDYYDARSAERKDNSEYIKIGAAGLITGLGVWAAMRKYS
jgi:hypothetical protein